LWKTDRCLEKLEFLFEFKAVNIFNRRNTFSILRIKNINQRSNRSKRQFFEAHLFKSIDFLSILTTIVKKKTPLPDKEEASFEKFLSRSWLSGCLGFAVFTL